MARRKIKRAAPKMSQKVKQQQNVKINIKNILPQMMREMNESSGDYIAPKRGLSGGNLNMGSIHRLEAPMIRYAIRPPEFLPFEERAHTNPPAVPFNPAQPRVGRPDVILTETNPSDIATGNASIRAVPSNPVVREIPLSPATLEREIRQRAVDRAAAMASVGPSVGNAPMARMMLPTSLTERLEPPQADESQLLVSETVPSTLPPRISPQQLDATLQKVRKREAEREKRKARKERKETESSRASAAASFMEDED